MTTSTAALPSAIQSIFDKARTIAKSISDIAQDRDKAEISLKIASDNFDSEPSRKSLDALAKSKAELERLADVLPDDQQAIDAAKERIFSDPGAWTALSEALQTKAEQFDTAATLARADFAEAVKVYILSGGTVPTLIFENRFGGLEADKKRDALEGLLHKRDTLTAQSNLARYISQGQEPSPGVTFESVAEFLNLQP